MKQPSLCILTRIATLALLLQVSPLLHATTELEKDRARYATAMQALERGDKRAFILASAQLRDYPLYPYIEYARLTRVEPELPLKAVQKFLEQWPESPLAPRLRSRMLQELASERDWNTFDRLYEPTEASVSLQCWKLRAEYQRGERKSALAEVPGIWLHGRSLPKVCDPLFDAWIKQGGMNGGLIWKRLGLALDKRSVGLARYLVRLLPEDLRELGERYVRVHQMPHTLEKYQLFGRDIPEVREIVAHGIERRRRRDPEQAIAWWKYYENRLSFSKQERSKILHYLALAMAAGFRDGAMDLLHAADPDFENPELLAWRMRTALNAVDWQRVRTWSLRLMALEPEEPDWHYWQARALKATSAADKDHALANKLLDKIAGRRHFYGFLAAEQRGRPYGLEFRPVLVTHEQVLATRNTPAVQRALELYSLNKHSAAHREWRATMRNAPDAHQWAGAQIAYEWGWYYQSIMTMIRAGYWDDLKLRFPVAWQELFRTYGARNGIDLPWAIAVSRQESALLPTARSSANARGLMQLLPSTAKRVARSVGAKYRRAGDLSRPELNIQLGTAYLGSLYRKYGVRAHSSAAYNAGPHRVRRWLERGGHLDRDAWIETIPFRETRGYVKNVLTFRVIYAHLEEIELKDSLLD